MQTETREEQLQPHPRSWIKRRELWVPNTIEQVESHGGYKILYADPNWQYVQGGRGSAENQYETSDSTALAHLPVARLAAKDAVLFLWGTWPQLPVVLATGAAWGFVFKTCAFVWVKYHEGSGKRCVGGGFWTRANTEFCLVFVRGKNHPKRLSTEDEAGKAARSVRQLIETGPEQLGLDLVDGDVLLAPRMDHSAKPAEARRRIFELLGPDLPAIELFARCVDADGKVIRGGRVDAGWDQWGDECDSDIVMTLDSRDQKSVSLTVRGAVPDGEVVSGVVASVTESANAETNEKEGEENMAHLPKGWGKEVADAEATIQRNRLTDGEYVFLHTGVILKNTQEGDAVIIEHIIVESKKIKEGVDPLPPGTKWGHFMPKYGKAAVMLKPNMKAYCLGLLGLDEKKVPKDKLGETIDLIGGEEQLARGMYIKGTTFHTTTDEGKDFMGVNWFPVQGENNPDFETVKKRRAELDKQQGSGDVPAAGANGNGTGQQASSPPPPPPGGAPPPPPAAVTEASLLAAGWKENPAAPAYFYRYEDGQPIQKLKSDLLQGR